MSNSKLFRHQSGDGNYLAALAGVHAAIQFAGLFQITPTTQFAEWLMEFQRQGLLPNTRLVLANGEDDAFTACHTASQCGVRVLTGSCSQGLLFAAQPIKSLAGSRCPVVIAAATRATSAPISIHASHDDVIFFRDSGIITWFAKKPQEVYDLILLAFKVAEDRRVQLPIFVGYDGFDVSHTIADNIVLNDEGAKEYQKWVGTYSRPNDLLNPGHPVSLGGLALPNYFMEIVYAQMRAMENVLGVTEEAMTSFSEKFHEIPGLVTGYKTDDAEQVIISMGSTFGTTKEAVDIARSRGIKAGTMSIMSYHPFPVQKIRETLAKTKAIAVLDRAPTFGAPNAPLACDVTGAFYNQSSRPAVMSCIAGLGGRTLTVEQILQEIIDPLQKPEDWAGETRPRWIGVAGGK